MDQPTERPKVSIITLNYNQLKITCELLDSLERLTYPNWEIIVVDNASKENPATHLAEHYPHLDMVIVSPENLGFSAGNNLGIKVAKGDYLFLINNDTEVTEGLLEALVDTMEADSSIGMVSPKIRYFSHPDTIQYAGFQPMGLLTGRAFGIGDGEKDEGQHDVPGDTGFAHGAAMMVRREVIDKVGMMPEIYFLYYEELDWASYIRRAGYRIYYQPKGLIYHKESMSVGKASPLKTYYQTRNRILYMRRNVNGIQFLIFLAFFAFFAFPKGFLTFLLKGQMAHWKAFVRGVFWHFGHLKPSSLTGIAKDF